MSYSVKYFDYRWKEITQEQSLVVDHYVSMGDNLKSVYLVIGGKVSRTIQRHSYCRELYIPVATVYRPEWIDEGRDKATEPIFDLKIIDL